MVRFPLPREGFSVEKRFLGFAPVIGVILFLATLSLTAQAVGGGSFSTPLVMGFPSGDDWEPAVASDGQGHVYVLITHFGGVPNCGGCADPSILVQVSGDGGATFGPASPLIESSDSQYDPQVKVNESGAVFVSYLLGKDTVVQRSVDHGASWSAPVVANVGIRQGPTDKDGLAVRGSDVYVGFDVAQRFFVAASHDGGQTFAVAQTNTNTMGWPLNGAAAVGADGTVYMVWELIHQSGNALGLQDVLVTKSSNHGLSWTMSFVDQGLPPGPACPETCGWDFLGSGSSIAVDAGGTVYVLYNAPSYYRGPPLVWFRSSPDGENWSRSQRMSVSADATPSFHVFPTIDAGAAGDVRIAWMDNRTGAYNVWYRNSTDGGQNWLDETMVTQFRSGSSYVTQLGFAFPYGDYFVLALDPNRVVHVAWGEGPNYSGPGNVLYAHN